MKLTDVFSEELIEFNKEIKTKEEAVAELVSLLDKTGKLSDKNRFEQDIYDVESDMPIILTENIALLHALSPAVKAPSIALLAGKNILGWDSGISYVFMAASDNDKNRISVLMTLASLLLDGDFFENMKSAESASEIMKAIEKKA